MTDVRTNRHIVVGLSGGVDSAVAALLLKEQGHRVTGLFMKNWDEDDAAGRCTAARDLEDVKGVCARIGIELRFVNFSYEYWEHVFQHFLAEYGAGRTPNPDVLCNREIKFRTFLDFALGLGADGIATGHYARIEHAGGRFRLLRARDRGKDQSYFLHALDQRALGLSRFPLGELRKAEVRELARRHGLAVHDKKDSTGICFIGERRFRDFLQRYLPARPGEIRSVTGELLGRHQGLMYHTLGQRKGLGIGGRPGAGGLPWYVVGKDLGGKVLYVAQGGNHPGLFSDGLVARGLSWVDEEPGHFPFDCVAKVRYRQSDQRCRILGWRAGGLRVRFAAPQRAVTPGQSIVFYDAQRCLGGGVIEELEGEASRWQNPAQAALPQAAATADCSTV